MENVLQNQNNINIKVSDSFLDYINDWDYETYLDVGGYGSGKSWHAAFKIVLKCLKERRKVLVVREVYDTIRESCFALLKDILGKLDLLDEEDNSRKQISNKVIARNSPMQIRFPNGSLIIFKGLDKASKIKSIHGVSIVWLEECSEIKFVSYEELLGRLRENNVSLHFILTCNPVGRENWVYNHFFARLDNEGNEIIIMDEEKFYTKKTVIKDGVYYHHSVPEDNPFLPVSYLKRLDKIKEYDPDLWRVAKLGQFGANGTKVLPQIIIAKNARKFKERVKSLGQSAQYFGFDFGFEESYNAVLSMSVDIKNSILYIWDEIYINKITDDKFANLEEMQILKYRINAMNAAGHNKILVADNEDPKAIQYYRQQGFKIRGCKNKFAGSRLSNTRKIKRFHKIIISPKCKNTRRELESLTYKKDAKGNIIYDEFNIDPHTFSAIWYALDTVTVADLKEKNFNSKSG